MLILEQVATPVFTLNLKDHDDAVVRQEVSMEEIKRLQQELGRKNNLSQFGLARILYDDEMIRFSAGFSSVNVLKSLIDLKK